jgi:hypothetical protein
LNSLVYRTCMFSAAKSGAASAGAGSVMNCASD